MENIHNKPTPEELFIDEFQQHVLINLSNFRKFKRGEADDFLVIPFHVFPHVVLGFLVRSKTVSGLNLPGLTTEETPEVPNLFRSSFFGRVKQRFQR